MKTQQNRLSPIGLFLIPVLLITTGCTALQEKADTVADYRAAVQRQAMNLLEVLQAQNEAKLEASIRRLKDTAFSPLAQLINEMLARGGEWQKAGFVTIAVLGREDSLPPHLMKAYFRWLLRDAEAGFLPDEKLRVVARYPKRAFKAFLRSLKHEYHYSFDSETGYIEESAIAFADNMSWDMLKILNDFMLEQHDNKVLYKCCMVLCTLAWETSDEVPKEVLMPLLSNLFSYLDALYPAHEKNNVDRLLAIIDRFEHPGPSEQPMKVLQDVTMTYLYSMTASDLIAFFKNPNPAVRLMVVNLVARAYGGAGLDSMRSLIEKEPDTKVKSYYAEIRKTVAE